MKNFRLFASLASMIVVAGVVLVGVLWQLDYFRRHQSWTLATGDVSGNYHQLGQQLASVLNQQLGPQQQFRLQPSAGSAENAAHIADGEADFAFVQSNAAVSPDVQLVATLYDEVLHVLVRSEVGQPQPTADELMLQRLAKLDHVSLGPIGSGTCEVADMLLEHFEVKLQSPALYLSPAELQQKFADGELDAAFVLAAPGSQTIEQLLDENEVELLPLSEGPLSGSAAEAFATLHPTFRAQLIPARMYGRQPRRPVQTIGVNALLVASEHVDFATVRQVTRELFAHRNHLVVGEDTPLKLAQQTQDTRALMPLHPGAEAFYHRENPSFLVVYAEVIALGLTLLVGLWSIVRLFLRWLADVKKERIDEFYLSVREAAHLEGEQRLAALHEIHDRAFDQLMREKLIANESFVIFHDYLLSEIARAERAG